MTYLKVFTDFRELMAPLSAEEKGRLFDAMLSYAMDSTEVALEGNERFIWPVARRTIDQEAAAYESKVEANRERARKGAEARWGRGTDSTGMPEDSASIPKHSENAQEQEQEQYQEQEQKEDQYQEHSQEYVYEQPAGADTHTPSREEIESYCRERGNGIDGGYFYDYYAAKGWRTGRDPITDWRALVRAWEKQNARKAAGPGSIGDTVQGIVNLARAKRRRQRKNSFDDYQHTPSHIDLEDIALTLDDEL